MTTSHPTRDDAAAVVERHASPVGGSPATVAPEHASPRSSGRQSRLKNPWVQFAIRRTISLVAIICFLVVMVFGLVRLVPGDPAVAYLGDNATSENVAQVRTDLGLDGSLPEQFVNYVSGIARGDLGTSFTMAVEVSDVIKQRIGVSAELAGLALLVVLVVAIPLGVLAGAATQGGRNASFEGAFVAVCSVLSAIPEFFVAILAVFIFAIQWGVLPASGTDGMASLVLPVVAVSLGPIALLARVVRVETVNVLSQDYIRMARSQRLHTRTIYVRHVLPNSVTAAVTIAGLLFASIMGSAVVVETVFNRPGLGTALVTAVHANDYPLSMGIILVLCIAVVVMNVIVDVAIALIDRRALTADV